MKKDKTIRLDKAYRQRLKVLTVSNNRKADAGLQFFVEHLKYLRDCIILKNIHDIEQEPVKTSLATISTALTEFEAYQKATESKQKSFHWNTFCDFVKLNMEEWLKLNDSV